jgi:hypothetical protein
MPSIINATTTTGVAVTGDNSGSLQLATNNGTTAVTIDTSQNVGIGETSPLGKLHIKVTDTGSTASAQGNLLVLEDSENGLSILNSTSGAGYINFGDSGDNDIGRIIYDHSANSMQFWANASERMRIDSSGNLLVGTTSASTTPTTKGFQVTSGGSNISVFDNTDGLGFSSTSTSKSIGMSAGNAYGGGAGNAWIKFTPTTGSSASVVVQANSNGVTLSNNATAWASSSDLRLKNITGTYANALSDIAQIEPVKFTWKADKENQPQVGVIAQSVENVVPEAISKSKSIEGDDTEYLQVRYTELIPLLIASIQELNAKVDAQAVRIAELEGAR